jgi:hypothetical protein
VSEPTLSACLGAYLRVYQRRRERRPSKKAHDLPEFEALSGLVMARLGRRLSDDVTLMASHALLDEVTRPVFEAGRGHGIALDIAGVAWAEAYGVLTLPEPALEHLEWTLDQAGSPRPIRGLLGVAWRILFLLRTIPQLNWRTRRRAEAELDRRARYLLERGQPAASVQDVLSSTGVRLAYVLAQVASHEPIAKYATGFGRAILSRLELDELPTAALCQAALVAKLVGDEAAAREPLESAVADRRSDLGLLTASLGSSRLELAPWVPLALIEFGASALPVPTDQVRARARSVVSTAVPASGAAL